MKFLSERCMVWSGNCNKCDVASLPVDVLELFNCYNTTLTRLVNLHAPVVTVTSYSRLTAPLFDCDCQLADVRTRRLEKVFRSKQDAASEFDWREQFFGFTLKNMLASGPVRSTRVAMTIECCGPACYVSCSQQTVPSSNTLPKTLRVSLPPHVITDHPVAVPTAQFKTQ